MAQLLKHALGLHEELGDEHRLLLGWHRLDTPTSDRIQAEAERLGYAVASDFDFRAITYQEFVRSLASRRAGPSALHYLADRYGSSAR